MELGAYLDQNGNAYVFDLAEATNVEYLEFDLPENYTRVFNEYGGTIVTPADIRAAFVNHSPNGTSVFFDSLCTAQFFNDWEEDFE